MRFINDDVKLTAGSHKAVKITKEDLGKLILKKALHAPEAMVDVLKGMDDKWYEGCEYHEFLQLVTTLMSDTTIQKDNEFQAYAENVLGHEYEQPAEEVGSNLMGVHTLDNGLTFFGFAVGGDCAAPMFMVVYYDGENLRLYTPSYGNQVNLDLKCPLGTEWVDEKNTAHRKLFKKYQKLGVCDDEDEFWMEPAIAYLAQYDISVDALYDGSIVYNWDAIRQDIETSIEVE